MKKNLFLGVMAATMLFATSCQKDEDLAFSTGENAMVSFSVSTPEIATRAYSDGQTATVLQYAVYDSEGNILSNLTKTDGKINISTTVNLQLTTGNKYSVIFWAAAENAPYTVNFDKKTMTVSYDGAKSNDEKRDAFYKYHEFTVKGAQTETIELRRPFAQLNIGTNDYEASENAGYVPTTSAVTVKNIYKTLSLVDGVATEETEAVFAANAIPDGEEFPVAGYEYLAMNYLLVNTEKEVVEVEFTYADASNDAKTRTVGSVPVQRNYRTNIYGQLLTSDVDINVTIEPTYEEPAHEAEALYLAAAVGGEVKLENDVQLDKPLNVVAGMELDLNGKTITGNWENSKGAVIEVAEGVTLKVVGGTISSTHENGNAAIKNYGTLIVEDATLNGAPSGDSGNASYALNSTGENSKLILNNATINGRGAIGATNGTKVEVNGGTYHTPEMAWGHAVYASGAGTEVVINGGTFTEGYVYSSDGWGMYQIYAGDGSKVIVNDGDFSQEWDCANGYDLATAGTGVIEIKGGIFADNPASQNGKNFVADGFKAVKVGENYYVMDATIADATETAGVTTVVASVSDVSEVLATDNGTVALYEHNGIAYIAEYGAVTIAASAENTTTSRWIVEESTALKEATVAEGIEVLGNRTFRRCKGLETITLPSTLTEISTAVFQSCEKLANVTIPASVTAIGEGAFAECKALTSITIPDGINRLEKDVLRATGLTSIEIPASVTYIGTYAFRDCEALSEVKILAPEFTMESNAMLNAAAPYPTMTIYVVNEAMKAYVEQQIGSFALTYTTVVVM